MIAVWAVLVGDTFYDEEYVARLQRGVARNLSLPYRFNVITDREHIPGATVWSHLPELPGWWQKVALFAYAYRDMNLYLDLDSVITGPLDGLLDEQVPIAMSPDFAPGGGYSGNMWGSAVIAWRGNDMRGLYKWFTLGEMDRHHGHQSWLTAQLGVPSGRSICRPLTGIASYKWHCQRGLPPGTRVVEFHGQPKPHQVSHPPQWMTDNWY